MNNMNTETTEILTDIETEIAETDAVETELTETEATETAAPETEVAETTAPEAEVAETELTETEVAETTAPETEIAETELTETDAVETEAVHTHIDFSTLDLNDPEAVAGIELDGISCEACLEAYQAHFGDSSEGGSGDLLADVEFNPMNFVTNLPYMGTGMVGIFIVIALIMVVTTALNKAFSGKKNDNQ